MSRSNLSNYPVSADALVPLALVHEAIVAAELAPGESASEHVVTGRVTSVREHGAMVFVDIEDYSASIQLFIRRNDCPRAHALTADLLVGDWVQARGLAGRTQRGENSLFVSSLVLTAPCLTPLPDLHVGITDRERLRRERTLDLVLHAHQRETLVQRSQIIQAIRTALLASDFLEVETPILHPVSGGASAAAFETHYNALSENRFLRIAPEFYLERLIIAGMPRVFEFARNFRNEGVDATHSPEFTSLEWYTAHSDCDREMERAESVLRAAATVVDSSAFDVIARVAWIDAWNEAIGCDVFDEAAVAAAARENGIEPLVSHAETVDALWDHVAEPTLVGVSFVHTWPAFLSPLARPLDDDARFVGRWDIYVDGIELGCCYQELNDPIQQRAIMAAAGNIDEGFLQAMELGMPSCSGVGIGIDRLVMILCQRDHIRDVIAFPDFRQGQGQGQGRDQLNCR